MWTPVVCAHVLSLHTLPCAARIVEDARIARGQGPFLSCQGTVGPLKPLWVSHTRGWENPAGTQQTSTHKSGVCALEFWLL